MTGARHSENPWKRLAASIVDKAQKDCRGCFDSKLNNTTKALIQYDAEYWLRTDPWCKFLLDCMSPWEYDVDQDAFSAKEHHHKKKDYQPYLPKADVTHSLPISELAKLVELQPRTLERAACSGRLEATKKEGSGQGRWYTSIASIAAAVAEGSLQRH